MLCNPSVFWKFNAYASNLFVGKRRGAYSSICVNLRGAAIRLICVKKSPVCVECDKSGNSRFEYTKMLNTAHAGTLAGLAALRTKCSHMCHFIRQGATRRRMQLHMCQIFIGKRRGAYSSICVILFPTPKNRRAPNNLLFCL